MANPEFDTGFLATFAVGANELATNMWTINGSQDDAEAMNSKSGTIPIPLPTWQHYTATVNFDVDRANPTFSGGAGIGLGAHLTNLNFYQKQSGGKSSLGAITTPATNTNPGWTATDAEVKAISNPTVVKGSTIMNYTMTLKLYGTVTTPY